MNKNEVTYGYLANEYYNDILHPTCSNLRTASKALIKNMLESFNLKQFTSVLEMGAGKSVLMELVEEGVISSDNIMITDSEEDMLQHSRDLSGNKNYKLKRIDAEKTGFKDNSFDLIISSLGDPYNSSTLWFEISRILSTNGLCIFTTPSFDWSSEFRGSSINHKYAEFLTRENKLVKVPSFIYPFEEQNELISGSGLEIVRSDNYSLKDLNEKDVSPKLKISKNKELPIVTAYLIGKQNGLI